MNNKTAVNAGQPAPQSRTCPDCRFVDWGSRADFSAHDLRRFCDRIEHRRLRKNHEYLHHAGSALGVLYVINSGFVKTIISDGNGHEQITGFSMPGDLLGMDAIATGKHQCSTIALEDSSLCGMVFADLEQLNREIPALQHHFHQTMGAEITRDHGMMLLLGAMRAEERVAMFLLNLSRRFALRSHSETRFRMPMTRQEIGNYLGLQLETVSRAFSHLASEQLIAVDNKEIEIKSVDLLQRFMQGRG
jgi:CRP/FNR family transcriptional regulator